MIVTIDPTTQAELERFQTLSPADAEPKLAATDAAARAWATRPMAERAALFTNVASRLRADSERLSEIASREMGKPIAQARAEVEKCAWCCDYFAQHAESMLADVDAPSSATRSYVAFRPIGVVLAIMPWNFPYWQVIRAAAPAIMAGNGMLLKHAPNTTRCALEIERIFHEAGAPGGLFTALIMTDLDVDELIADPRIAAVTLTGSERAGIAVASAAGAALKKCVLELGGSDAFVVLGDADIELAATTALTARFQNNGQSCIAAKRFIVVERAHDEFLMRFVELAKKQRVGNPMETQTQLGPLARGNLREGLDRQVRGTIERGGRVALGGKAIGGKGFFYEATIVDDVEPGMPMFDQETFGPAAAIVRARDAAHAIELANASSYGLGFSIWTRDVERAQLLGREVQAGAVFVNGMVSSDPRLPFGGVKKSGYGRELSAFGIHEFVNVQTVWVGPARTAQAVSE